MTNYTNHVQYFADQFVQQSNAIPNKIADAYLYDSTKERIAILAKTPELASKFKLIPAQSNLARGGTVSVTALTAVPAGYNAVLIGAPPSLQAGDVIAFETGVQDLVITLPTTDITTQPRLTGLPSLPADMPPPVTATGTATPKASDRQLVVYENNATNPDAGRLIAIPPGDAAGISLPTFNVSATLPVAGSIRGESVFVTSVRRGYIWDGAQWNDITSPDWVALTQTQYNALPSPLPGTLYVITGP